MINYKLFHFASPPLTGENYFIKACQQAGLGPGFEHRARDGFHNQDDSVLRISLVRHPIQWLANFWEISGRVGIFTTNHLGELGSLSRLGYLDFDSFLKAYATRIPGAIGRLYNRYEANTCLRFEDMPWALIEFLKSVGVAESMFMRVKGISIENTSGICSEASRRMVRLAEQDVYDKYEYF